MIKYANICGIKFRFINRRRHETHFCARMEAIEQLKKNDNHKHSNPSYHILGGHLLGLNT